MKSLISDVSGTFKRSILSDDSKSQLLSLSLFPLKLEEPEPYSEQFDF